MPKVSVILPCHNCQPYIKESILSILNQSFQDFELIVIEDGSGDSSLGVVLANTNHKAEIIIHKKNKGLSESLNDGLRYATGELIAIQHGDDVSLPTRLEKQVKYLDEHPNTYLVSTWTQFINEKGKVQKKDSWWLKQVKRVPDDPEVIRNKLLEMNCLVHTAVMFRRKVLETCGNYDVTMPPAEDYDLWLRISEAHDIGIIRETLCHYRSHSAQISQTKTETGELKMRLKAEEARRRAKVRRGII